MIYSIQYLRGLAAILVLLSHSLFKIEQITGISTEWFTIGSSGVDLFFIISGFIMCHATENRTTTPVAFFKNRIKRIIPLYWTLTLLALAVFLIKPELINSSGGNTTLLHSFTLIPTGNKLLIQNGWTLSYEFLFYLIFAASLITNSKKLITTSCMLLGMIAIGLIQSSDATLIRFITSPLLFEFFIGILCYWAMKNTNIKAAQAFILIASGAVALALINNNGIIINRVISYGLPYALIVIGMIGFERFFIQSKNNITSKILRLTGDASYSLYLVHPFALAGIAFIVRNLHINLNDPLLFIVLFSSSYITGILCYKLLEVPLTNLLHKKKAPTTNSQATNSAPSNTSP
jgi:exopolysaccharide production protein ExoZ